MRRLRIRWNSTIGTRKTSDGAQHDQQGNGQSGTQPGRATNAGKRTNANNESKVSKGGKAGQAYQAGEKPSAQPKKEP